MKTKKAATLTDLVGELLQLSSSHMKQPMLGRCCFAFSQVSSLPRFPQNRFTNSPFGATKGKIEALSLRWF